MSGRDRQPGWALLLSAGLAAACGSSVPATRLSSIAPAQCPEGQAVDVELSGEGLLAAVVTDFGRATASSVEGTVTVELVSGAGDALPLEEVMLVDARTVRGRVPASVPRGLYDIHLVDARGGEATLTGAFSVVTPAESVAAFTVEPIAGQHPGVPFPIRLLAVDAAGGLVESFAGTVTLGDDTGTLSPATPFAFVRGRLVAFVTVSSLSPGNVVHVTDALGHTGDSEAFDVTPGPAARVVFSQAPTSLDATVCGGPFRLELLDQFGFPVDAAADEPLTLSAVPLEGVVFSSDAACATPLTTLVLAAGTQAVEVYSVASRVGPLVVRASPATLPTVEQAVTVQPLPPTSLTLSAPAVPLRAGVCSPPLDIQAEDALGNASPPAAPTPLTVAVTPVSAALLFSDDTCSAALGALVLDTARPRARVHLLAADAGAFRLEVVDAAGDAGTALAPAVVDVEVQP